MAADIDKPTARAEEETIQGVRGVRFRTDTRPDTEWERKLQEIQYVLSGGKDLLPSPTTEPHLNWYLAATVDGPSETYISLWVPVDQRDEATRRLEAAGFTVS